MVWLEIGSSQGNQNIFSDTGLLFLGIWSDGEAVKLLEYFGVAKGTDKQCLESCNMFSPGREPSEASLLDSRAGGLHTSKWSHNINDSSWATAVLPHRCRAQPVGKRKPWLIWTYGFLIQVKMSEPCCIWCHFSLLKMPHKAVTKGEEMEKNTVITHSRAGFCGSLASGLRD